MPYSKIIQELLQSDISEQMKLFNVRKAYGYESQMPPSFMDLYSPILPRIPRHSEAAATSTVPLAIIEGQELFKKANDYKLKGNDSLKHNHLDEALDFYLKGLRQATEIEDNFIQVSVLFSNASYVLRLLKRFPEANVFAYTCLLARPTWYKGCLRCIQVTMDVGAMTEAFMFCLTLLHGVSSNQFGVLQKAEHVKIYSYCVKIGSKLSGNQGYRYLSEINIPSSIWEDVFPILADDNCWNLIRTLLMGDDVTSSIVASFDANKVKLHGLVKFCEQDTWKDWGQKLTVNLLHNGARYGSLAEDGKHGLHAAFKVGMTTGQYQLLRHLFLRHVPPADIQMMDSDGNTLLHLACRDNYNTKEMAITMLMNYNFDPAIKNKQGKMPVDFLVDGDPLLAVISVTLAAKGEELPKRTSTGDEVASQPEENVPRIPEAEEASDHDSVGSQSFDSSINPTFGQIQGWSTTDVHSWFVRIGLVCVADRFVSIDGSLLAEFDSMQRTAPEYFYEALTKHQHLSAQQILRFSGALRSLRMN